LKERFDSQGKYEKIEDKIDNEIKKINDKVSFGLPMLIKPISDLDRDDKSFITAIEYGAYTPALNICWIEGFHEKLQ